ncbi:MAG: hypothetical protein IJJ15_04490 [Ruminococcus sp.]|nr:hypothetical protein [Ruminococcus sp.]
MKTLYTTNEYKGYGKQNYYHNEYRIDGDMVTKHKCHRQKIFDGKENNWETDEKVVESWNKNDSALPKWLRKLL